MMRISQHLSPRIAALTVMALLPLCHSQASAQSIPAGWTSMHAGPDLVLTPPDLPSNAVFNLTIYPPTSLGSQDLQSWLIARMDADMAHIGTLVQDGKLVRNTDAGYYSCARIVQIPSGEQRIVGYSALNRPGGKAQLTRVLCTSDRSVYTPYLKQTVAIVTSLALSETATSPPPAASHTPEPSPSGGVLKSSEIEGVFLHTTTTMGVGGVVGSSAKPILALKDGTYYEHFDVPPSDFNVTESRLREPQHWLRWRREGAQYQVMGDHGWENEKWDGPQSPAPTGLKLSGEYSSISGGGNTAAGGGTMVASVHDFTFHPNGHFDGGGATSASSPGAVSGATHNTSGTYQISGYAITLRFSDGRTERRSFLLMDGDKKIIYLNGAAYVREDKR